MEMVSWFEVGLVAIQIGYSFVLKHVTSIKSGWIPVINFAVAFGTHTLMGLSSGLDVSIAFAQGAHKGLLTMIATTGIHSAAKNTIGAIMPKEETK